MNIENLSLAEIVTARPAAATIFENLHLDFCCRGKQKLNDALSNDPLKLAFVKDTLEKLFEAKVATELDFNSSSLTELIDYIVRHHHKYVKENMPVIQQHIKKVVARHEENYPVMRTIDVLFDELKFDFDQHLMKEELILFPKIKHFELTGDTSELKSISTILRVMELEHLDAGNLIHEIRTISNEYTAPENSCTTFKICMEELKMFEADLHKHVHLENNVLFSRIAGFQPNTNAESCSCAL